MQIIQSLFADQNPDEFLARYAYTPKQFTHAIVRRPAETFASGITTQHLGQPDMRLVYRQHDAYINALEHMGARVTILDADKRYPDSVFVEDVAVIHHNTAIITRPAEPSRQGEVNSMREVLSEVMATTELDADDTMTVDGGDVLLSHATALIGISRRTTLAGARQLIKKLQLVDKEMIGIPVPIEGVLHLKSGMTALLPDVLVRNTACSLMASLPFPSIELPAEEGYAANTLPINGGILVSKGFPTIARLAREHYSKVIELDMSEFRKMDGSLTCLSLLW